MFFRRISRSGMSWSWPGMPPGKWVFESNVPLMFDELHQPRLLEVIPSATLSRNQTRDAASAWNNPRSKGELGASVKYGVTSTVTLEGTVNPDFSQVESDAFEVEVNNRFPIFFSEKRPFFMEGLGLFNLAGTGGDANMRTAVHTRRIIDPSGGLKVTGTAVRSGWADARAASADPRTRNAASAISERRGGAAQCLDPDLLRVARTIILPPPVEIPWRADDLLSQ